MKNSKIFFRLIPWSLTTLCLISSIQGSSQQDKRTITLKAGPQYTRSSLHQFLWGKHYRKEWNTPVTVPYFYLDTAEGGLKPYQAGGGLQTYTLRLRNSAGKEYVLRSIDKDYGRALPDIYKNTFVENIIKDQVSSGHPYAAFSVPRMAEAAGVFHTIPKLVYVPSQPALDSFNQAFGNKLYLFEQRPDENWEEAPNFGYSRDIISTKNLLEKLMEGPKHQVEQVIYLHARLLDMVIGDWSRHEDQWRWASHQIGENFVYMAIPRDRDQVYTKFEGFFLKFALSAADLSHLETFNRDIKDIESFNHPARRLDRLLTNKLTREDWTRLAKTVQERLTDAVIQSAVKNLPPEVYPISGEEIISKLKARRDKLVKYAEEYYSILAEEVDITGTKKRDLFEIVQSENSTSVKVYEVGEDGQKSSPYYSRVFPVSETDEVRVYGIEAQDIYELTGSRNKTKLRIVGGPSTDEYKFNDGVRARVYDNPSSEVPRLNGVKPRLSNRAGINDFRYDEIKYDERGFKPSVFYASDDRLYVGLGYEIEGHRWRVEPFAYQHSLFARYSITQKAFNILYKGVVNEFIAKWNLGIDLDYDVIRWTNFYGLGNETPFMDIRDYFRMRSRDFTGRLGLNRRIGKRNVFGVFGSYQNVKIVNDTGRFLAKQLAPLQPDLFNIKHFISGGIEFQSIKVDHETVPRKGYAFFSNLSHTQNLTQGSNSFTSLNGRLDVFIPILKNLVLFSRLGGGRVNGRPEFYQYPFLGGSQTLRGFRRERFYGKTTAYNTNELQFLFNVKSNLFNGTMGLIALHDEGRVWHPGEDSRKWHTAVGGGFLIAPFNMANLSLTYAVSDEFSNIHIRFVKPLK